MEGMKNIFKTLIEAKLASAPDSQAKTDLVEELADNLHCRYEDMVRSGVNPEEALVQAMDALGDVDELLEYLNNSQGDAGEDRKQPGSFTDDMGEMFRNIGDMVKGAVDQAKTAVSEVDWAGVANSAAEGTKEAGRKVKSGLKDLVKKAKENGGNWKCTSGGKTIHVTVRDDGEEETAAGPEENAENTGAEAAEKKDEGWKLGVTVEKNPEDGGEPDPKDRAFYGVGYDPEKGGLYGQWGKERSEDKVRVDGPVSSVTLRGIDVQLAKGDVTVCMNREPEADVLVGGENVGALDITVSEGGVLMVRPGRSSSFFGVVFDDCNVDLQLELPRRDWDFLRLSTVSGDVSVTGDHPVGNLTVKTTSGDFDGALPACACLEFTTVSGDMNWQGDAAEVRCSAVNGDVTASGDLGKVTARAVNGDVELRGAVDALRCDTTNGDLTLVSERLPKAMVVNTRAGDCKLDIPDGGSFRVSYELAGGDFCTDFFTGCDSSRGCLTYGEPGGAEYSFRSGSGDVSLYKY